MCACIYGHVSACVSVCVFVCSYLHRSEHGVCSVWGVYGLCSCMGCVSEWCIYNVCECVWVLDCQGQTGSGSGLNPLHLPGPSASCSLSLEPLVVYTGPASLSQTPGAQSAALCLWWGILLSPPRLGYGMSHNLSPSFFSLLVGRLAETSDVRVSELITMELARGDRGGGVGDYPVAKERDIPDRGW